MLKSNGTRFLVLASVFAVASVTAAFFATSPATPQRVAHEISVALADELAHVDDVAKGVVESAERGGAILLPQEEHFAFYVYDDQQLLAWGDNRFVPTFSSVADTFQLKLLKAANSVYLAKKWKAGDKAVIALVPLYRKFNITNDYLRTEWNRQVFPAGNVSILDANATIGVPVCVEGICPFRISFIAEQFQTKATAKVAVIIFGSATLICMVLAMLFFLNRIRTPEVAFIVLFVTIVGIRLLMTWFNFPLAFLVTDLFNPQIFAESAINASLGDLLLNELGLFIICFFLFRNIFRFRIIRYMETHPVLSWFLSIFSGIAVLFGMLFPFVVIQTLYNNSSIIIDISESIRFDGIRIAATLAVLLAGVCAFLFSHVFVRLLIGNDNKVRLTVSFCIAIGAFALINIATGQNYVSSLIVGILYFLIIYALRLFGSLKRLSFSTFTYLFVSIFFMSANGAYAMYHYSREDKIDNQFRFASDFLIDRDYFGEYLLRELYTKIEKDAFIQQRMSTLFLGKDAIRQKIREVFLSSYFNKYDVEIYLFNSNGEPVDNRTSVSLAGLLLTYNEDASRTEYEGVYFVRSPGSDVTQKYLVVVPVGRMRAHEGYVVVELSLKRVIPQNVYPELLVDNRFLEFYRSKEISYAVYANRNILYSSGSFNYEALFDHEWIGDPEIHMHGIHVRGYDHIAVEDDAGRVAIVSSQSTSPTQVLANFSFLLVLGLATILIFILIQGLMNTIEGERLFFAARIQLLLNLAFFLPLIIVSAVTLGVTRRSSQNQMNDEYLAKTRKFSEQVASQLNRYNANLNIPGATTFETEFANLAKLTDIEANIYHARGTLMATSQPLIFENGLVSTYINPRALHRTRNGENLFIETENIGSLSYYVAYSTLKSPSTGESIGILGIPFFQSIFSLEKVHQNIVANILIIFALIFIALVVLSYFVSQWLTFPLTIITQSLRKTSLTKTNQPLVWKSDDEIGLMVKEYNQMLYKLSESKAELEQTQRERAWREIAQQVAHEIKNPLTPMKLMLQQLERSIQSGSTGQDKMAKAIASMLTQVNTLDEIASSFSSFARMPEPVMKPLELVSLLRRIIDLHSSSGNLIFDAETKALYIQGDEQLLGRTFSNIILNALQATRPGDNPTVWIKLQQTESVCTISFRDNGKGIEPSAAERIFVPLFTTKKSGSGLGLAIAKQGIEHMGGRIWFETQVDVGTTFFISLPIFRAG